MVKYLVMFCFILVALFEADEAVKKEGNRKKGLGKVGYIVFIVANVVLALLASWSKIFAVIIAIALGVLALMNREGICRAKSWIALLILNAGMMLLSIAKGWDEMGRAGQFPKFSQLKLLIIPLLLAVVAYFMGRKVDSDDKSEPSWWNRKKGPSAES